MLDLVLSNEEESIRDIKIGGSLSCSNCAVVQFVILKNVGLAKKKS